ncbi:gamma-glutamyl-gamma-aminobutyrate hydrolase family protein [Peptoniphilus sp. AGMB00490]|uniref:Gamma-glutamyl-gamma-aminobutyrate hydrolase family protein n=1 Tax=Peptoniphilus faecalis TaxID=2731255 RepID=A0A848RGY8_9FIRM|nr:gamma-glutamyl-gamma-aminobutyrate hydrolase family protein [Peptoniphilus faecalis]NMW85275.1 gamma-glutamyl-gamma-aminobutyrate hydrolase family protein [Peptoniphilus faecalis]
MRKNNIKNIITYITFLLIALFTFTACSKKENKNAPTIGISWSTDEVDKNSKDKVDIDTQMYADALRKAGAKVIFLKEMKSIDEAKKEIKDVDGVVVTGGDDLNPNLYNENPIEKLEEINPRRDSSDVFLLKALLEEDKPTLATCRGMQLTNVLSGGSLYQDIITQRPTDIIHRDPEKKVFVKHEIDVLPNNILSDGLGKSGKLEVNSWHHQAIKDLGKNLDILAKADDGTIEAIVKTDKSYFLGLQFHPEAMIIEDNNKDALNLYKAFITKSQELSQQK